MKRRENYIEGGSENHKVDDEEARDGDDGVDDGNGDNDGGFEVEDYFARSESS